MTVGGDAGATIAIVGRPNVGKSTLFNRLVGKRLALVDDQPGVTRDRREGAARLGDLAFTVVDTAGLEEAAAESLSGRMRAQTERAIADADLVLFMVDTRAGVTEADRMFGQLVRRSGKPVVLLANKAEARDAAEASLDMFALGLGEPVLISAEHGGGMGDLRDAIVAGLPWIVAQDDRDDGEADDQAPGDDRAEGPDRPLRIAVMGRPNAGKSTLINRMLGEERLLTGPEAGITRDAISVPWSWEGRAVRLFDTAGMRKRARIDDKLEKLAVADALRAIRFAEVVVLLLDATIPFEKQDLTLADLVEREGRAVVIGLNKWDLVDDPKRKREELREAADRLLPQLRGVALVPLSALAGQGIERLMAAVLAAEAVWNTRVATARINRWLTEALARNPPPAVSGRRIKIRYMTQVKARPPTFALFGNQLGALPESYLRYLINGLRDAFALPGAPIRILRRTTDNPFDRG